MKGKRTGIEFENHEVKHTSYEGVSILHLKKPNTLCDAIKYINAGGILAVTGDYGNWIFCREFHPTGKEYVSDSYWEEKLRIASTQDPYEFDEEGTIAEIDRLLKEEEDLDEAEIEYLNECKSAAGDTKIQYELFAYNNGVGRFQDYEYVPSAQKITKYWLKAVFDGFEEICRRMKVAAEEESKITSQNI